MIISYFLPQAQYYLGSFSSLAGNRSSFCKYFALSLETLDLALIQISVGCDRKWRVRKIQCLLCFFQVFVCVLCVSLSHSLSYIAHFLGLEGARCEARRDWSGSGQDNLVPEYCQLVAPESASNNFNKPLSPRPTTHLEKSRAHSAK